MTLAAERGKHPGAEPHGSHWETHAQTVTQASLMGDQGLPTYANYKYSGQTPDLKDHTQEFGTVWSPTPQYGNYV